MSQTKLRLAILDMNNNVPNRGLANIKQIVSQFADKIDFEVFDVRHRAEIPFIDFDVYISSGGPGSPLEGDGNWDTQWFNLVNRIYTHNLYSADKKYFFFICHSFQMACIYFKIGRISKRPYMSFGTYPVYKTDDGEAETLFQQLPDPFYIADFRHWQVVQPDAEVLAELDAKVLAIEQLTPLPERAIMAVRFSDEFVGTQFHPEADALGMLDYFQQEERKQQVLAEHGENIYRQMIKDLYAPQRIDLTQRIILPTFLKTCLQKREQPVVV